MKGWVNQEFVLCVNDHFNSMLNIQKEIRKPLNRKPTTASFSVMAPFSKGSQTLAATPTPRPHQCEREGTSAEGSAEKEPIQETPAPDCDGGRQDHSIRAFSWRIKFTQSLRETNIFTETQKKIKLWNRVKYCMDFKDEINRDKVTLQIHSLTCITL